MAATSSIRIEDTDYARLCRLQLAALEATGVKPSFKDLLTRGIDLLEQQRREESQAPA